MRLNQASDFALRILMLLAQADDAPTVEVVASRLDLAKSHVMKIIAKMSRAGIVTSRRGRVGGIALGKPAADIRIGDVVRLIEADFAIVECLTTDEQVCCFQPRCALRGAMVEAGDAFLGVLDRYTLKDIVRETKLLPVTARNSAASRRRVV